MTTIYNNVAARFERLPAPFAKRCLSALICLTLSACAVGPDYQRPDVSVQSSWQSPTDQADEAQLAVWWQQFADPRLSQLLQLGRDNSPTLQSAAVRIAQARAQLGISQGAEWPVVQLSFSRSYSKPDLANQLQGKTGGGTTQQLSLQASWEPDLWGAARREVEGNEASWLSTVAAYQAAMVALEANIATTYFNLRTLEQRLQVAQDNLKQQAENLRIANARFRAGASSEQDLRQAQVLYEQTGANLPTLRAALQQAQHALSVLVGQTPDYYQRQFAAAAPMPSVPTGVPSGIPRDLLQRRPDVLQAEYAAIAQSARIGQAKAALFPSFSLGGSFGFQSSDSGSNHLDDLFKWHNPVSSATAGLLMPIFNHGQLVNQVRVQDAAFEQAILNYQNQVLGAQQEVEDALSAIAGNRESRQRLNAAAEAARRSTVLALERYKSGESDFTTVTTAYQAQLQVEDGLAQAQGNLLQSFVAVYRALGGGWDGKLTASLPDNITKTMRARTNWGDALDLPNSQRPAQ
ncbi:MULTISPECIES: efflux transporter outer membrane subunit [unclassified Paludibacterium]|uniref:efflux transporter outer membrane subunit n=1 Tax=unclassified Paludibacterium TaxID=2618429 RepID=UPI001C04294A|nr:efflux transporter outer membrane subunit [Paludibacterium sp. B53371]BEV71117.1 efflux transporter outer membrane subunit [Paludibacterium sp. THUN1379]